MKIEEKRADRARKETRQRDLPRAQDDVEVRGAHNEVIGVDAFGDLTPLPHLVHKNELGAIALQTCKKEG